MKCHARAVDEVLAKVGVHAECRDCYRHTCVCRKPVDDMKYLNVCLAGACTDDYGMCDHLCLPTGTRRYACACATGYILADDRKSCETAGK